MDSITRLLYRLDQLFSVIDSRESRAQQFPIPLWLELKLKDVRVAYNQARIAEIKERQG